MPEKKFEVYGDNGLRGVMFASARFLDGNSERVVKLEDGRELRVPADALEPRPDGSFYLRLNPPGESAAREEPRLSDQPRLTDQPAKNGSSDNGKLHDALLHDALFRDTYEVEHVKVDQLMDQPATERREGDNLIFPVVEEVLVVEKKYLLKEEIHIRKRREQLSEVKTVQRGSGVKQTA
jgi:hypothetical protein